MSDAPRSVLVVDLSSLFWTTAIGMRASYTAGDVVLAKIRRLAHGYDRVAVAIDANGHSFRRAIYPEYKARDNPERTPERWAALSALTRECADAGFHLFRATEHADYEHWYFESDDVIAALVSWCVHRGVRAAIASGDSDLAQLVDDSSGIVMLRCFNQDVARLDSSAVEAWKKVPPARVVEVKALAGDGDGYKPFPGIAETTAIKLLRAAPEFTALSVVETALAQGIVKNKDGKTDNAISRALNDKGMARVEFGYSMARLRDDAPVAADTLLSPRMPDWQRMFALGA